VVSADDVNALKEAAMRVNVNPLIMKYIVEIVAATRSHDEIHIGSSPRGSIALLALSRAYALAKGRGYVIPDDVKYLASHALSHRISLTHEAKLNGRTPKSIIESILTQVAVPIERNDA
jgi:MoxR-like ATPase